MLKTELHMMWLTGTGQEIVIRTILMQIIILMILTIIGNAYESDKTMKYDHITGIVNEYGKTYIVIPFSLSNRVIYALQ